MGEEPMETNGMEEENKPEPTTTKNGKSLEITVYNTLFRRIMPREDLELA
jgi:hypothetical protein